MLSRKCYGLAVCQASNSHQKLYVCVCVCVCTHMHGHACVFTVTPTIPQSQKQIIRPGTALSFVC